MYTQFFRLNQAPFSIAPDPRYLFMTERHREALAHLLYGVESGGGLVVLTGDIGTGKTTVCRCFLEQVPANCRLAYIFNPKLSVDELLQTICEEFHIELPQLDRYLTGAKDYVDALNTYLLASHAEGRNNVLVIDEAQNLSPDVLEQLRLLTNLETNERKLLQIILIGQPELRTILARPELEQLAQRVIAHYHLTALSEQETASYIQHRLATAGLSSASPFQQPLMKQIYRLTRGVPRRINLLCDRALLGAYARGMHEVDAATIEQAAGELFVNAVQSTQARRDRKHAAIGLLAGAVAAGAIAWAVNDDGLAPAARDSWVASIAAAEAGWKKVLAFANTSPPSAPASDAASVPAPSSLPEARTVAAFSAGTEADSASGVIEAKQEASTATPEPAPAELDNTVHARLRNEAEAMRRLAQLWGASLRGGEPCIALEAEGVRCHKSSGGLAELRRLDRPAVLTLYDHAGKPFPVLLTALGDARATLRADGRDVVVRLALLTRHFRGEFVTLWRPPPGMAAPAQLGDQGPAVDWIAAQLARLNDMPAPAPGQPFDPRLVKQVRQLQQAHGLFVDGVVGPATAMQLNRAAGVDEPRLHNGA